MSKKKEFINDFITVGELRKMLESFEIKLVNQYE
jgi:hypothetical protein